MSFKDQIYIDRIARKLWKPHNNGAVSVMIGAGFSRSASINNDPKFPLWNELSNRFRKELSLRNQLNVDDKKSPLKLASEFEATFDRKELEKIIESEIPDLFYEPHEIHEILLKLPWSDIFTTNYDTLLERAAQNVFEYKYSLVYRTEDLPGKIKPRIIKLHGSIPTVKPYIITEEDYRTYPREHAGFVNTVQQSLMENTLCMLGFSGEDPNFLQWIGWVRDNLGDSIEQVYLCGILDLSNSERDLLIKRKIRPIDLSPLFPIENYGKEIDKRHTDALRWFLLSLYLSKPPVKTEWPKYETKNTSYSLNELPIVKRSHGSKIIDKKCPELNEENTDKIIAYLRDQRKEYPGWIIAPAYSQNSIWYSNYMIGQRQIELLKNLSDKKSLTFGEEIAWVFDLCLFPFWDNMADYFLEKLIEIDPIFDVANSSLRLKKGANVRDIETDNSWGQILVSLVKYYREKKEVETFLKLNETLTLLGSVNPEFKNEGEYQKCLFFLETFQYKNLLQSLKSWQVENERPIWLLRKSGFELALGHLESASLLIDSAFESIRRKELSNPDDYEALSTESLALYLKSIVDSITPPYSRRENYRERFEILRNFKSDFREVVAYYEDQILSADITVKPKKRTFQKFDPGVRGESYNLLGSSFNSEAYEKAYRYLRTFTELSIPYHPGTTICINKKALIKANDLIAHQEPRWVFINLFRLGEVKEIENWYDRVRIENLNQKDFDFILNTLLNAYEECIENIGENIDRNYALERHLNSSCVFLSLFCFRADKEILQQIFELSIKFYETEVNVKTDYFYQNIETIFKRLIYSVDTVSNENLFQLLKLKNFGQHNNILQSFYRDPIFYVQKIEPVNLDEHKTSISEIVSNLINDLDSENENQRHIAFQRLSFLDEKKLISQDQEEELLSALWKHTDSTGFPDIHQYFKKYLAKFQKNKKDNEILFRNYLINSTFDRVVKKKVKAKGMKVSKAMGLGGAPTNDILINEFLYGTKNVLNRNYQDKFSIEFDQELYIHLKTELLKWWNDDKDELNSEDSFNTFDTKRRIRDDLQNSIDLVVGLLIPFAPKEDLKDITSLIDDMKGNGISTIKAYPSLLSRDIKNGTEVLKEVSKGLNSPEKAEIDQSLEAIELWYVLYKMEEVGYEHLDQAIKELIRRIVNRREPGLDEAILTINNILNRDSTTVLSDPDNKTLLINALEYLFSETEFPNEMDRLENYNSNNYFDQPNYIVNLTAKANQLARLIFMYLSEEKETIPDILTSWKKRSLESHLPELNRVWK